MLLRMLKRRRPPLLLSIADVTQGNPLHPYVPHDPCLRAGVPNTSRGATWGIDEMPDVTRPFSRAAPGTGRR